MNNLNNNKLIHKFLYDIDTLTPIEYDTNLVSLFLVVEKIEKLSSDRNPIEVSINNGYTEISVFIDLTDPPLFNYSYIDKYYEKGRTKFESLYYNIILFIKWYNKSGFESVGDNIVYPIKKYNKDINRQVIRHYGAITDFKTLKSFIANVFGCKVDDLTSKNRSPLIVVARHLFLVIVRKSGYSLRYTGSLVERDHATVLHSIKKIRNIIDTKDYLFYDKVKYVLETKNINLKSI